ncbi:MAG: radical SAM/SPASM domain-containing protein [Bacteroidales bacterium]
MNVLKFKLGSTKPVTGPLKVAWDITYRCNSRCITCSTWKNENPPELGTDECKIIIDELAKNNVISLSFSGGEPLLRRDIYELISYAKEKGLNVTMNSNASLINEKNVKKLCDTGLDIIYISVDGSNKYTHDKLRGISGSFERTISNVNLIKLNRKKKPKIYFNTTINKYNANEIYDIVKLGYELGIDGITMQPIHSFSDTIFSPENELILRNEDLPVLEEQLKMMQKDFKRNFSFLDDYLKGIKTFIISPNQLYKYRCVAAYLTMVIGATGEVYPCPTYFRRCGSIQKETFKEIWYSNEMDKLRKDIKENNHPICWFTCVAPINVVISISPRFYKFLNMRLINHILRKMRG